MATKVEQDIRDLALIVAQAMGIELSEFQRRLIIDNLIQNGLIAPRIQTLVKVKAQAVRVAPPINKNNPELTVG